MKNFYNIRAKNGRFYSLSKKSISFRPTIVSGRLYSYKGIVVRAKRLTNNGLRHISFHKFLNGFVHDDELKLIDKQQVEKYLDI